MTIRFFKILLILSSVLLFFFLLGLSILYWKKDNLKAVALTNLNESIVGEISIQDTHISPFANFPYISVDFENLQLKTNKTDSSKVIFQAQDVYVGFDLFSIILGEIVLKRLKINGGSLKLNQDTTGTYNIVQAFETISVDTTSSDKPLYLDISTIDINEFVVTKYSAVNDLHILAHISKAKCMYKDVPDHLLLAIESDLIIDVIYQGDTSYFHNKHVKIDTKIDYFITEEMMIIEKSDLTLENADFDFFGEVDLADDFNVDISLKGEKDNFDILLAFAPPELAPALARYENQGKIYFDMEVKGKSDKGHIPRVELNFGCENAYFRNKTSDTKMHDMSFKGYFRTEEDGTPETMEFALFDVFAKPELGDFNGSLFVKNFESPEINTQLDTNFDLAFLADFFNIEDLQELTGSVGLNLKFHDIIDLNNPEKSIANFNDAYFAELTVKNLSFRLPNFPDILNTLNLHAGMDGSRVIIDKFLVNSGNSDLSIRGEISDLPAIIHHLPKPVTAKLNLSANRLDFGQMVVTADTSNNSSFQEVLTDVNLAMRLETLANAYTESPNLPLGEFFIDQFQATLQNYPHRIHDFKADIIIDTTDFRVIDFSGELDESDFHFNGTLQHYDLWFADEPLGDTKIAFDLHSNLLKLENLLSYNGQNYLPEDYRHEELRQVRLKGHVDMHFNSGLQSTDIYIDSLEGKMKIHPMLFQNFGGRIQLSPEKILAENVRGTLGQSSMIINMQYQWSDSIEQKNYFQLVSPKLNFDELFAYNPPPVSQKNTRELHEQAFNIYTLPFPEMEFEVNIADMNYHRTKVQDFYADFRTTQNHYIYIDTMYFNAAGGTVNMNGYMNGEDSNAIYFSPRMVVKNIDIDALMLKFDNFGQDEIVSDNLHGFLTGEISGMIHVHPDLIPIIDDSTLEMDIEVVDGRIENYAAFMVLSDYFKNKNLAMVRFDTLKNIFSLVNGDLIIPRMTINSSLGFMEISGRQSMDLSMEYYLGIPVEVVTSAGMQKLFGKKEIVETDQIDEIQYRDQEKKVMFMNIKLEGTPDNYKISVGKNRS